MTAGGRETHKRTKTSERNYSHKSWPKAIVGYEQLAKRNKLRLSATNSEDLLRHRILILHCIQNQNEGEIRRTPYRMRSTRGERQENLPPSRLHKLQYVILKPHIVQKYASRPRSAAKSCWLADGRLWFLWVTPKFFVFVQGWIVQNAINAMYYWNVTWSNLVATALIPQQLIDYGWQLD